MRRCNHPSAEGSPYGDHRRLVRTDAIHTSRNTRRECIAIIEKRMTTEIREKLDSVSSVSSFGRAQARGYVSWEVSYARNQNVLYATVVNSRKTLRRCTLRVRRLRSARSVFDNTRTSRYGGAYASVTLNASYTFAHATSVLYPKMVHFVGPQSCNGRKLA